MTTTAERKTTTVAHEDAERLAARLSAEGSLALLDEALSVYDQSIDRMARHSVGVNWVLKNLVKFGDLTGWNVAGWLENRLETYGGSLLRAVESAGVLQLIPIDSDRYRVLMAYYVQHGTYNCDWVGRMKKADVPLSVIGDMIVARLRYCTEHPRIGHHELWRELDGFCEPARTGHIRQVRHGEPNDPGVYVFDNELYIWGGLDDEHFADCVRIVAEKYADRLLSNWFLVRVKLHHNPKLLGELLETVLTHVTVISHQSLLTLMAMPIADRKKALEVIGAPERPYYDPFHDWWMQAVPEFTLLLEVVHTMQWSPDSKKLFEQMLPKFSKVDPVLLYRAFRLFSKDPTTPSDKLFHDWIGKILRTQLREQGYRLGTLAWNEHNGRRNLAVVIPANGQNRGHVYVLRKDERARDTFHAEGDEVAYKPGSGRVLVPTKVTAVMFYPIAK